MDRVTFSRADRSNEITTTSLNIPDMTAMNFDIHQSAILSTEVAMAAITQADAHSVTVAQKVTNAAKALAGLREMKWLVRYRDVSNFKEFSFEIGTADPSAPTITESSGKEVLDPSSTEWTDLANALNTFALSPYGNGISMYEVELVGRST